MSKMFTRRDGVVDWRKIQSNSSTEILDPEGKFDEMFVWIRGSNGFLSVTV